MRGGGRPQFEAALGGDAQGEMDRPARRQKRLPVGNGQSRRPQFPTRLRGFCHAFTGQIDPRRDRAAHDHALRLRRRVGEVNVHFQHIAINQRLDERVGDMNVRQGLQKDVLPDAAQGVRVGAERIRRAGVWEVRVRLVEQMTAADADQQVIVLPWMGQRRDVQIKRGVGGEVPPGGASVHQDLALARHSLKVQLQPPALPSRRDTKLAPHPGHLDPVPDGRVTREVDGAGPVRVRRARPDVAPAAPCVDVPGRGDFDGRLVPAVRGGRRQGGRDALIADVGGGNWHRLELPAPVQAQLGPEGMFGGGDQALLRRKIAGTGHGGRRGRREAQAGRRQDKQGQGVAHRA